MSGDKYRVVWSLMFAGMLIVALLVGMTLLAQVTRADPGDWFVTPAGAGTACSQAAPCSLQTALTAAVAGDSIYVAAGTYTHTGDQVVLLDKSVTLLGGWDGSTSNPPVRDPVAHLSILDGEGARRGIVIRNGSAPTIDGFTIVRGKNLNDGGGIYVQDGSPLIASNIITNNTAGSYGGGIYVVSGTAMISGNQILSNSVLYGGAAVWLASNSRVTFHHNTIMGNQAGTAPSYSYGAAVRADRATFTATANLFLENRGSSILMLDGQQSAPTAVRLVNNVFARNVGIIMNAQTYCGVDMVHNTVVSNSGTSAPINVSNVSTLTLVNNIAAFHQGASIEVSGGSTVTGTHNLFWMNASNPFTLTSPVLADPALAPDGYHLALGSPAVDGGADSGVADDVDGNSRPINAIPDIGADEKGLPVFVPIVLKQ